jgi:hypothetical protein
MMEGGKTISNWFDKNGESTKGFLWDMFYTGLTSLVSPDTKDDDNDSDQENNYGE